MRWVPMAVLLCASTAMAAPTVLDFEDIAAGTRITTQYSQHGVLFRNNFLGTDPAAPSGTRVLRTANPADEIFTPIPLVMTFTSAAQSRVQLLATSGTIALTGTLVALDAAGNVVAQDGPKPVAANVFTTTFEVKDPDATPSITQAELRLENGIHFAIDDLAFEGAPSGGCPLQPPPSVVEIREADPKVDKPQHDFMRSCLMKAVGTPNTTILLGPNVVLDFADATDEELPLDFGSCVTLTSARTFPPDTATPRVSCEDVLSSNRGLAPTTTAALDASALPATSARRSDLGGSSIGGMLPPARTPQSLGPLLKFGPHRSDQEKVFLQIHCIADFRPNDHVRISGFRIHGPSFGQQSHDDIGIHIIRCLDIEISNMELAGWGGQAVQVLDEGDADDQPADGPGQVPPNNFPGERIGRADQVRIFRNYIHHNQHPRSTLDNHTAGYGVDVHHGAWAQVYENVFDFNRHAVAAAGDTGGYEAFRNLVLKGGGLHYGPLSIHTHQFDIHGSGGNGFGGRAGVQFGFAENSFQYLNGAAIEIRGRPQIRVDIHDNVFPHEGLEDDEGDDAVHVEDRDDLDVIHLGPNNAIDFDPYGRYGVCDFDGDGIDDLFLATGQTWWFSSFGEFPWSYLGARIERLHRVRLGYFDDDQRCDVLTESDGEWVVASGGTGPWQSIGVFEAPLSEVVFGRFDPRIRDHRPGVTRRTTHAFWRTPSGQWLVTPLSAPAWQPAQSSSFPLSQLRFGDFTGDGVTDVLAVQGGRWSISQSARGGWQRLNQHLSDDVRSLHIADLDHNNIDDLIRLERTERRVGNSDIEETFTWWVSDDGRSRWRKLKAYTSTHARLAKRLPVFGFAGRFGAAPGGGVLLIDHHRIGNFFSEAEIAAGTSPDWRSLFAY
jgi:hypothetical protein